MRRQGAGQRNHARRVLHDRTAEALPGGARFEGGGKQLRPDMNQISWPFITLMCKE